VSGVSEHLSRPHGTFDRSDQRVDDQRVLRSCDQRPTRAAAAVDISNAMGWNRRRNKPLPPRCRSRAPRRSNTRTSRSVTAAMSVSERVQTTPGREPLTRFDPRRHLGDRARSYVCRFFSRRRRPAPGGAVPSFIRPANLHVSCRECATLGLVTLASSSCSRRRHRPLGRAVMTRA